MAEPTIKRVRNRSPNYPAFDLEKAVEWAALLYKEATIHLIPVAAAHKLWGYETSSGNLCVAALRAYGLAKTEGSSEKRKIRVSDLGRRIVLEAPDRPQLLQKAAVSPMIHAELWGLYEDSGVPPDATIRAYLLFERDRKRFNEDAVDDVIERFRKTISFAKLGKCDILDGSEREDDGDDGAPRDEKTEQRKVRKVTTAVLPLPIPMEDGTICIVDIPRMTSATFAFFTKQLETYKSAIILPPVADTSSDESDNA